MALVQAKAKYVRVSPYKIRPVIDQVRGKSYSEAKELLMFSPKLSAEHVLNVLNSAAANAENVKKVNRDELYVSQAFIDEGPALKRIEFRAMGRANRLKKRTSHITIGLSKRGES